MKECFSFSDYEFQVGLIECLMRMFPRKQRQHYAEIFIKNKEMLDSFLAIKDREFETVFVFILCNALQLSSTQLIYINNKASGP